MPKMPPDDWLRLKFRVAEMENMLAALKKLQKGRMASDARRVLSRTIVQAEKQLAEFKR